MYINSSDDEPPRRSHESVVIISDPIVCKNLWNDFVKSDDLFDSWDFRRLFSKNIGASPYFINLVRNNKFCGTIPLEYLPLKDKYFAFGGGIWNEYNFLYIGQSITNDVWNTLASNIPLNSELGFLRQQDSIQLLGIKPHEETYYLNIPPQATNMDFYLERLSGSSRRKLQQKMRNVEKSGIIVQKVDYDVSACIKRFSIKHFGNESTFRSINLKKVLEKLTLNPKIFNVQNFLFTLDGEIVAAASGLIHNQIFYAMAVGYSSEVKDLGKYVNYFEIDFARAAGAKRINFFAVDCGWKEMWKLEKEMLYKYEPQENVYMQEELVSSFRLLT